METTVRITQTLIRLLTVRRLKIKITRNARVGGGVKVQDHNYYCVYKHLYNNAWLLHK